MEIQVLEQEIKELKQQLSGKEAKLKQLKSQNVKNNNKLTNEEIARYSRQIILADVGVKGQLKLKNASVLIVGAGGLGCPSALYLSGAGIGHIGIVDYDEVEINNLHRQLLHRESTLGMAKVDSAKSALFDLNSNVKVTPYQLQLNSENALEIISQYDVILDATDNVATRYLLNDACVLSKKPLVSGSAIQMEGQLTVYNYQSGPCYRCIFPDPPPPETVTNCGDGGVIGAITGVIGALQALEAIKIIIDLPGVLSGKLLLFDGSQTTFRNVRLRLKSLNCLVCSDVPKITELIDYEQFCRMKATDKDSHLSILEDHERITVQEYEEILRKEKDHLMIDVRGVNEFEICQLEKSINMPIKEIVAGKRNQEILSMVKDKKLPVYLLCRRGNDSQLAVAYLKKIFKEHHLPEPKDMVGGLHAWTKNVDAEFPIY